MARHIEFRYATDDPFPRAIRIKVYSFLEAYGY